jgi:hypothetical protein
MFFRPRARGNFDMGGKRVIILWWGITNKPKASTISIPFILFNAVKK